MIISCPSCQKKYQLKDEVYEKAGAAKIRCKACGTVFPIRAEEPEFEIFTPPPVSEGGRETVEPSPSPPPPEEATSEEPAAGITDEKEGHFDWGSVDLSSAETVSEETPAEEPAAPTEEPAAPDWGSVDLSSAETVSEETPAEEPATPTEEPAAPAGEWGNIDLAGSGEEMTKTGPAPSLGVEEKEMMAPPVTEPISPEPAPLSQQVPPLPGTEPVARKPRPGPPPARGRLGPIKVLLMLIIIGVGAFVGYKMVIGGSGKGSVAGLLTVFDHQGRELSASPEANYYIVTGAIRNEGTTKASFTKVKGIILNEKGKEIETSEVFCGNVLSDEELRNLSHKQILQRLNDEFGEGLSNLDLGPGGEIPFMIVFYNPPSVSDYRLEVIPLKLSGRS